MARDLCRYNILERFPEVRSFLRSEWWPERINFGFTRWVFPLVIAGLFLGPQDRDHNVFLNFFWVS
jgi:hypothetical protein